MNGDKMLGNTSEFLRSQEGRLQDIERSLLGRVEEVLPIDHDLMTVTELVHVCKPLHAANLSFIHHVAASREADDVLSIPNLQEISTPSATPIGIVYHVERKLEIDKEKDGITCSESELACEQSLRRTALPKRCRSAPTQDCGYVHSLWRSFKENLNFTILFLV